jgi:hypothetical protein
VIAERIKTNYRKRKVRREKGKWDLVWPKE